MKAKIFPDDDTPCYGDILAELATDLGISYIIDLTYEADCSGEVAIEGKLKNKKYWVYAYSYGSCSGCDEWQDRKLSDKEIKAQMKKDSVFYSEKEYVERLRLKIKSAENDRNQNIENFGKRLSKLEEENTELKENLKESRLTNSEMALKMGKLLNETKR